MCMMYIYMIQHELNAGIPKTRSEFGNVTNNGGPGVFCIHWLVKQLSGHNRTVTRISVHRLYNQLSATLQHQFRSSGWVWWL